MPSICQKLKRSMRLVFSLAAALAITAGLILPASVGASEDTPTVQYDGLKKTVSVDPFQVTDAVSVGTAEGMAALLIDAISRDGRFVVVERVEPLAVPGSAGPIQASAVVRGAVTKFEAAAGGSDFGIGGLSSLLGARAGIKNQKSMIEISLRLIDTTTGQVISTSRAQGTASSSGLDIKVEDSRTGASAGGGTFRNTPIGKAAEDAIAKAVEQIAAGMKSLPWSALVIDAEGDKVFVNAGAERNVQPGMTLHVYRKGKVYTDPSTGVTLDVDLDPIGVVRIEQVREKMSTAVQMSGQLPSRGDVLKLN